METFPLEDFDVELEGKCNHWLLLFDLDKRNLAGNIVALLENDTNDQKEGIGSTLIPFDPLKNLPQVRPAKEYSREKGGRRRKRRAVNPSYMPEIRIYRRDIRRRYGEMFTNVINMHDVSIMRQFLEEFFHPDCQVIRVIAPRNRMTSKILESASFNKPMTARSEMLFEYYFLCEMMPDSVMQLTESQVRVRQGAAGSLVVAKSLMKGTQLFTEKLTQQLTRNDTFIFDVEEEDKLTSNVEDLREFNSNCVNTPFSSMYPEDTAFTMNSVDETSTISSFDDASKLDLSELDAICKEADLDPLCPPIEKLSELLLIMVLDETNRVKEFQIEDFPISEKQIFSWTA